MKLQHTLGGLEGLGPIDFEKRVFVEDWEKRIFGIHTALMGLSDSLRPYWYKDPVFRARAAREPRAVLTELGVPLDDDTEVRVWDSSGHSRWFVVPSRPEGTDHLSEEELAQLVTTESMIGVAIVDPPVVVGSNA